MAFSRNPDNVIINGQTIVKLGGTDVGFVANVLAKLSGLQEDTTNGMLVVGFDGDIELEGKQTRDTDLAAWIDNLNPTTLTAVGNNDTATLISPTLSITLEKNMAGKTGSKIVIKATAVGLNKTQAKAFLTRNS